jgi:PAB1-binding protein PBP1
MMYDLTKLSANLVRMVCCCFSTAQISCANLLGSSRFKTDTDISGGFAARERQLQRWDAGTEAADLTTGLESSNSGPWDQFATNEQKFGLRTNYDESFYTTKIDRSHPQFKEREAEAERIAREIEGSSAMNSHIAEERGLKMPEDNGEDEEAK